MFGLKLCKAESGDSPADLCQQLNKQQQRERILGGPSYCPTISSLIDWDLVIENHMNVQGVIFFPKNPQT